MNKFKLLVIPGLFVAALLLSFKLYKLNLEIHWASVQSESFESAANDQMNKLAYMLRGKISKDEVIAHYRNLGIEVSEVKEGVLYFEGFGYEFDTSDMLKNIHARTVGFLHVMPNQALVADAKDAQHN